MRFVRALLVLALSCVTVGAASALTLDAFTDPFPPNLCLPNSALPILFVGPFCDGASCPPDPLAPCWENTADQTGLAGVLPGHPITNYRGTFIGTNDEDAEQARVRPESGRLEVEVAQDRYHAVHLDYGGASQELALDLTAAGATGLAFELFGDPTPAHPLTITVTLATALPVPGGTRYETANYAGTLDHAGQWVLPFSTFFTSPEFSYAEVDGITIEVTGDRTTPAADLPGRAWALGALSFASGPTASAAKSWGRLKALYR